MGDAGPGAPAAAGGAPPPGRPRRVVTPTPPPPDDGAAGDSGTPLSPGTAAARERADKRWRAAFHHVLHPRTHGERAACAAVWTALVVGVVAFAVLGLPKLMDRAIYPAMDYVKARWPRPATAALCFGGVAAMPLLLLPWRPFIWLASYTLGAGWALLLVTVASAATMAIAFLVARTTGLHDRCARWFGRFAWYETMLLAVKEAKPWRVVLAIRVAPVPYAFFNYAAALSPDITFWPYLAASVVGHTPDNAIHVFLGTGVASLGDLIRGRKPATPARVAAVALPFVAAAVCLVGSIYFGRRALARVRAQAAAAREHEHAAAAAAAAENGARVGEHGTAMAAEVEPRPPPA